MAIVSKSTKKTTRYQRLCILISENNKLTIRIYSAHGFHSLLTLSFFIEGGILFCEEEFTQEARQNL